ncbi:hypothetical protein GV791_15905 [Nocardia cyriacigeorgica]|uniref:DUF445 family protein n=2 Tax=Nocardia cyriacigeorgica TaxID=135487 RepID=H6R0G8_NOCCG|nr:hypothetical protein [Nocardia cyriacigeorgica]MBF6287349.1 hypothetical protein [Nocardia cyriacigeorgica]MBF6427914.1 hypothetical protein [Nocardia cyriacigeorgica]NEW34029.1 hypothetical protein [Nocardia cyriacigeorgica]CCF65437.1 conserved membrane protein of unknown function [Nocardia cyriacigeorgica GUH-2]BDU08513.1 hypothetical protein FMUBM48_47760 [Nocardia cyriacigeorgica]
MLESVFGVHPTILLELLTIPLFTGVIGYITNWTGVLMLFRPIAFHGIHVPGLRALYPFLPKRIQVLPLLSYDGRMGWQGIVPSRADKMASIAVDKGLSKLGSVADFYRELEPDALAEHLASIANDQIRDIVEEILRREHPQLWYNLPSQVREMVHDRVRAQLPDILRELTEELGANIDQLLDVKQMVIRYFQARPQLLNQLFQVLGAKELRFMQNFGFYFGAPMGAVLVAVLHLTGWPTLAVLPIGGVIIGWVVNWVGINMIFAPAEPKWWCPWRQGLLIKRQPEITAGYAELVSGQVVTVANIGDELLNGPRSDRTMQMLEDTLRPAADRALGPARSAVKFVLGSREYDALQSTLTSEAMAIAPIAFADPDFNVRQGRQINDYIAKQMSALSPTDFVEMLRSAIKQDEWLLFVHGGVLGLFAGYAHILVFGTGVATTWI